jgi:hypothetical protein
MVLNVATGKVDPCVSATLSTKFCVCLLRNEQISQQKYIVFGQLITVFPNLVGPLR